MCHFGKASDFLRKNESSWTQNGAAVPSLRGAAADLLSDVCADPPAADGGRLNEEKNILSGLSRSAEPVNAEWNPRKSVGTLQSSTGERPIRCLIIFHSRRQKLDLSNIHSIVLFWRRQPSRGGDVAAALCFYLFRCLITTATFWDLDLLQQTKLEI